MYKEDLALNNLQWLICHKTQPNQTKKIAISTQSDKPLRFVDHFTYLGKNISSTESDNNIYRAQAWNTVERLLIIWMSDQSDEIKRDFFQAFALSILL